MHKEILTKGQVALLPILKLFSKNFGLVGGTAIALHIGHRQSIDFDLFSYNEFNNFYIKQRVSKFRKIDRIIVNKTGEFTFLIDEIKFTFFQFPYEVKFNKSINDIIKMPDMLTLAAMKGFALGMCAKWKDYVDLYFVMRDYYSLEKISKEAKQIFGGEFNEKLLRTQLAYFKDIDYEEKISYLKGFKTPDNVIKKELIKFSLS